MVLLQQNYFLLQTLIKPLMLPLMARNISVIKLMFMEDDDVSLSKELYQCYGSFIWKLKSYNISQKINQSKKYYDVPLEATRGK